MVAATALALHQLTGQPVWDAVGSIVVGLLLAVVAVVLLQRNMAFLVGQVADVRVRERVLALLHSRPEVETVSYLHLEYVGPERLLVIGAVDITGDEPEHEVARRLQQLENALEEHPEVQRAVLSLAAPGGEPIEAAD